MVSVYLGEVDENKINNMSFKFFNDILHALGKRVNYDAVVNLAGNSFAKDAWKAIQQANPLYKPPKLGAGFMSLIDQIAVKPKKESEVFKGEGIEWAMDFVNSEQSKTTEST